MVLGHSFELIEFYLINQHVNCVQNVNTVYGVKNADDLFSSSDGPHGPAGRVQGSAVVELMAFWFFPDSLFENRRKVFHSVTLSQRFLNVYLRFGCRPQDRCCRL